MAKHKQVHNYCIQPRVIITSIKQLFMSLARAKLLISVCHGSNEAATCHFFLPCARVPNNKIVLNSSSDTLI